MPWAAGRRAAAAQRTPVPRGWDQVQIGTRFNRYNFVYIDAPYSRTNALSVKKPCALCAGMRPRCLVRVAPQYSAKFLCMWGRHMYLRRDLFHLISPLRALPHSVQTFFFACRPPLRPLPRPFSFRRSCGASGVIAEYYKGRRRCAHLPARYGVSDTAATRLASYKTTPTSKRSCQHHPATRG